MRGKGRGRGEVRSLNSSYTYSALKWSEALSATLCWKSTSWYGNGFGHGDGVWKEGRKLLLVGSKCVWSQVDNNDWCKSKNVYFIWSCITKPPMDHVLEVHNLVSANNLGRERGRGARKKIINEWFQYPLVFLPKFMTPSVVGIPLPKKMSAPLPNVYLFGSCTLILVLAIGVFPQIIFSRIEKPFCC